MVPVGAIAVALFTVAMGTAGLTYAYRRRDLLVAAVAVVFMAGGIPIAAVMWAAWTYENGELISGVWRRSPRMAKTASRRDL
jgi:hypothetical protein